MYAVAENVVDINKKDWKESQGLKNGIRRGLEEVEDEKNG